MGRLFDCCCRNASSETYGFLLLEPGKAMLFICNLFYVSALIVMAQRAAGCTASSNVCATTALDDLTRNATNATLTSHSTEPSCSNVNTNDGDDDGTECQYWGLNPATLVSQALTLGSLMSALMMPTAGSIIDHSSHRRLLGQVGGAGMVFINFVQVFLYPETWVFMMFIQAAAFAPFYQCFFVANASYMCELTTDLDDALPRINQTKRVLEVSAMFGFIIVVTMFSFVGSIIETARFAQLLGCLAGAPFIYFGWTYLGPRPALQPLPPGQSLVLGGFKKIFATAATVRRDTPMLARFLLIYPLIESASTGVVGLTVIYMQAQLCFESIGTFLVISLVFIIIGAKLSASMSGGHGVGHQSGAHKAKHAYVGILAVFCIGGIATSFIIQCPDDGHLIYAAAMLNGVTLGAIYPVQKSFQAHLIPGGSEASVQGLNSFCGNVLTWLPSLLFGVWREATGSFKFALLPLALFHGIGAIAIMTMIDMDQAKRDVAPTLSKRLGAWSPAARTDPAGAKILAVAEQQQVVPTLDEK